MTRQRACERNSSLPLPLSLSLPRDLTKAAGLGRSFRKLPNQTLQTLAVKAIHSPPAAGPPSSTIPSSFARVAYTLNPAIPDS